MAEGSGAGDRYLGLAHDQTSCCAVQGSSGVTDPAEIDKLCAEGRDAAKFLTQYVVQAELNERGNYGEHSLFCPAFVT